MASAVDMPMEVEGAMAPSHSNALTSNIGSSPSYRTYPVYKDSGLEWIGNIPSHWSIRVTRREYAIQLGKMLQPTASSPQDCQTSFLKAQHVKWESVRTTDLPTMYADRVDRAQYGVEDGDLLVCEGGEVGRAGIVRNPPHGCIIQNALHRVRSVSTGDIRFLMYLLRHAASQDWINTLCNRATIAHLTSEKLGDLLIPWAPLTEQRTIASFLDRETAKIDALVAKKERLIKLLQERRIALISNAVTQGLDPAVLTKDSGIKWLGTVPFHWQIVPVYVRYDIALGKMLDTKRVVGDYPGRYIRNVDVQWDWVNVSDLPQMDFLPEERNRYRLELGDVLICEGGQVGRTAIWQGDTEECFFQKAIHRARPRTRRDVPRYLFYVMYAFAMRGVFVAGGNPNTIDHLTRDQLSHYRFAFPPSDEQAAIVRYLDRETRITNSFISKMNEAIERLKESRTALVSAAITGKIDVRDTS